MGRGNAQVVLKCSRMFIEFIFLLIFCFQSNFRCRKCERKKPNRLACRAYSGYGCNKEMLCGHDRHLHHHIVKSALEYQLNETTEMVIRGVDTDFHIYLFCSFFQCTKKNGRSANQCMCAASTASTVAMNWIEIHKQGHPQIVKAWSYCGRLSTSLLTWPEFTCLDARVL